jgi:hypothetical protein
MATQFDSAVSTFGLTAQTGMLLESVTHNFVHDKKMIADADGDAVSKTLFNERMEGSMSGYQLTSGYTGTIAAAITLAATPTDHLVGTLGALTTVESISRSFSNTDYEKIELTFENYNGITS